MAKATADRLTSGTSIHFSLRQWTNRIMVGAMIFSTALVAIILFIIVGYILVLGAARLDWGFLIHEPMPPGQPNGGMANAIVGSVIMVGIAAVLAEPIGIGAAIFISEYRSPFLSRAVRFLADVLTGVPSIVVGLFLYALIVTRTKTYSGWAGAGALAFIMLPIVLITAQEALRLVPTSVREAALALGVPRWRVIMVVVLPTARRAVLTGSVIAIARAAGETAPLLYTAFGNNFFQSHPSQPLNAIPLLIFNYARGPYKDQHAQAWAASFVLLIFVFMVSFLTRYIFRGRYDE